VMDVSIRVKGKELEEHENFLDANLKWGFVSTIVPADPRLQHRGSGIR